MENKRKYDEFYYSADSSIVSFNKLNEENCYSYEHKIFCPDCRKAALSYVRNITTPHLKQKPSTPHQENCPYRYKAASNKMTESYIETLNDTQIKRKLDSMLRYLCTDKSIRQTYLSGNTMQDNPMLIHNATEATRTYNTLRRKSLGVYFTEEDKGKIYVFYGKAKLNLVPKKDYAFLKLSVGKKEISIYHSKSFIPNDIDENARYYIVCIGCLKDTLFKIELLKPNCLKYQKV
ncbi:hypothetical protein [Helicobacter japonicus]|uniref:hypothetical protein n=2 Tax=Helicobacter TaxID=209 RepID=UPI0026ED9204|nr:hypothetical protein [Helicobacter japonicus]